MENKKSLAIAAAVTALVLFIGVGITTVVARSKTSSSASQQLAQKLALREQAYQDLIEEANARIETLNAQVANVSATSSLLSAEQALDFAYQSVGKDQQLMAIPKLVNYQGATAFEIPFAAGLVYIDAANGATLASTVKMPVTSEQAVQIALQYLGIADASSAKVSELTVDGVVVFKVNISNYVVYVDAFGTITKVQVIQYAAPQSSGSSSSGGGGEREHESEDDD